LKGSVASVLAHVSARQEEGANRSIVVCLGWQRLKSTSKSISKCVSMSRVLAGVLAVRLAVRLAGEGAFAASVPGSRTPRSTRGIE
jgi:hypothetical protein